ncbi:hypothetical protein CY652_19345 [Burkholderia sp. WAC0059]|uniref:carboxypeptidase-like regulatory domain-containing protein n=1 Tax=Burkholderia sp. WAC0059 TaxID=2066022 RepID=UPI000C7F478B|nr:carboxypeptidase-like regulatory domain-containing protein [Burkholderia sp. WAC0059]PLZ00814.1 hypothetical protein CY652_19345 [Burkholderia sp. WAC0059]
MNTMQPTRRFVSAVLAALLAFGGVGAAMAQSGTAVGGSTTDNTSAGNANGSGMPQVQHQGMIAYVSGGVGLDESQALRQAESHWPLALRFTGQGSDYLADVHVRISDTQDGHVFDATSRGPYMLVGLSPGRYVVHASYNGTEKTVPVTVKSAGTAHAAFTWASQ